MQSPAAAQDKPIKAKGRQDLQHDPTGGEDDEDQANKGQDVAQDIGYGQTGRNMSDWATPFQAAVWLESALVASR